MTSVVTSDPQLPLTVAPVGRDGVEVEISERHAWQADGFLGVGVLLVLLAVGLWAAVRGDATSSTPLVVAGIVCIFLAAMMASSLTVVQPGRTQVVQFFGRYVGTVRRSGLLWLVPLTSRRTVSVRVRNFETARLKVNDATGNPVEIAAIVVWQVADTARATFSVEAYDAFTRPHSGQRQKGRSSVPAASIGTRSRGQLGGPRSRTSSVMAGAYRPEARTGGPRERLDR